MKAKTEKTENANELLIMQFRGGSGGKRGPINRNNMEFLEQFTELSVNSFHIGAASSVEVYTLRPFYICRVFKNLFLFFFFTLTAC